MLGICQVHKLYIVICKSALKLQTTTMDVIDKDHIPISRAQYRRFLKSEECPPDITDKFARKKWHAWSVSERKDWLAEYFEVDETRSASQVMG